MSSAAEQVKERLSIVDVVGSYVKLTKAGKNYKGLSPFKKEKTPSFYVAPDRGVYYDFSSGKGGDMFTFVEEMEGVDFRGALKILAERAGVELAAESKEARDERDRLFQALALSVAFFEANLAAHQEARGYLHKRGVAPETLSLFRLGYAPAEWGLLRDHLKSKGFLDYELEKAGLIKKGERGTYYDRFRSRVMFPINDASGRPIGFSGRVVGKAAEDKENAKYINSPEGPLYDKSSVLFGYDRAKGFIRKYDFSILVEGQMDLVMSHQAGWGNTVAVSGTGLTPQHLELLARLSKNIVLALDADAAGIASAHRSALMAFAKGMEVKIAALPPGMDPADLIKEDKERWRAAVRDAQPAVDFFIDWHVRQTNDPRKRARAVRESVLPLIGAVQSAIDAAHFVKRTADALGVPMEAVWADLKSAGAQRSGATEAAESRTIALEPIDGKERILRHLWGIALSLSAGSDAAGAADLRRRVAECARESEEAIERRLGPSAEQLMFEAERAEAESAESHDALVTSLLSDLRAHGMRERRAELSEAIKAAERLGEEAKRDELMRQLNDLIRNS